MENNKLNIKNMKEVRDSELVRVTGGVHNSSGSGMAEWALHAVGWNYVYGGATSGGVDGPGLIYAYAGGARTTEAMYAVSPRKGSIDTLSETPGLGLYMPGNVGVYVGNGMCVYAANEAEGVVMQSIHGMPWTAWFEIYGINYAM